MLTPDDAMHNEADGIQRIPTDRRTEKWRTTFVR